MALKSPVVLTIIGFKNARKIQSFISADVHESQIERDDQILGANSIHFAIFLVTGFDRKAVRSYFQFGVLIFENTIEADWITVMKMRKIFTFE
jgi:hypothetical protein